MHILEKNITIKIILFTLMLTLLIMNVNSVLAAEINSDGVISKNSSLKSYDSANNSLKINNVQTNNTKTNTHKVISKKKLKITTYNLSKKYGDSEKFQVKITNNAKGVSNLKIKLSLNSKIYYRTTDTNGTAKLDISNLKIGRYIIKSVIYNSKVYYSNKNTNKIIVTSQNPYKLTYLKWGSKGNIKKNKMLMKSISKTTISNKIINICKKGTPLIQFGNGSDKKVFIVAGVHGSELSSQAACFKLINNIYNSKYKIKGTIYIIPILSPKSTSLNVRYYNGKNLNKLANKAGSLSNKFVNYAKSKNVDAVGDFHCTRPGGDPGKNVAMGSYLPMNSSAILAKYISKKTKYSYLIYKKAGTEYLGAVEDVLNLNGITSVTCEVVSPHGKIRSGSVYKSYNMMNAILKYYNIR